MSELFEIAPAPTPPRAGRMVSVAVNANLWRTFDYLWPDSLGAPAVGQRVHVPFGKGNRRTLAFVASVHDSAARNAPAPAADASSPAGPRRLKAVAEVIDLQPQLDAALWKLGEWISQYYLTPLGMTLAAMIPSAVGRHESRSESVVFLTSDRGDWPRALGPKQKNVLDELLEARKQGIEPLTLEALLHHSRSSRHSVHRLADRGLLRMETRPVRLPELSGASTGDDAFELSDEQRGVLAAVEARLAGGFSTTLIYGVTGSGKTEVYVRAIRKVIAEGKQAILLVPEIALATQTLQRLLTRLPRVAVLHSGLTSGQRAFYYEQIRDGHASVVVGPRSAIFAPTRKLGLVVVDEEHEPTYKQDSVPRYHGRDVAVMRASLEGAPVILGSATPSLESLQNVKLGRYQMLRLAHRVRGLPMPRLHVVHLREETHQAGRAVSASGAGAKSRIELIGRTLTLKIAAALDRREQVILLLNRRGYASYVFCPSCQWVMACEHCSRTMVFHQATQLALCHYCQHTERLPDSCPACHKKLLLFGYGIQRIEGELARKFPTARVARMDSDTMTSPAQFRKVFEEFGEGKLDLLLGTQMVAKGLDFPRVSLVGVISADTSLAIPDFRASERTFQLIVQVAGRAGRADLPGEVIVQTLHAQEPAIQFAVKHDYDGFAGGELPLRKEAGFPPFARIIRFIIRHEKQDRAQEGAVALASQLRSVLAQRDVRLVGPQKAQVTMIKNQFRWQILLYSPQAGLVQQIIWPRMEAMLAGNPAEVIADVDPNNLL